MATRTYTSALDRLLELPEIFTGRNLTMKFQWSATTASTYLSNWRRAGLVRSLGGHSDIHLNLARNRNADLEVALRHAYTEAVRTGADVLREAGWTTQILSRPEIAISRASTMYSLPDFELTARSLKWFMRAGPGIEDHAPSLRRLRPAWALADMLARAQDRRTRGAWLLAPDDLDVEAAHLDPESAIALESFGVRASVLDSEASYCEFHDRHQSRPAASTR